VAPPTGAAYDYIVDGENRRVGKKVGGTLSTGFLYQDALNVVAQLDASNSVTKRFVYGSKRNVPDYFTDAGGGTYRILSDHLGSPRVVIHTTTGVVAQKMEYDEFGVVLTDNNPGFTPFGFAGGLYDKDTKLVRFGARDYDPSVGRWTAKDPILFAGGDYTLYAYVGNDPVNLSDPNGREIPPWVLTMPLWDGPEPGPADAVALALIMCIAAYDIAEASKQWQCEASCNVDGLGTRVTGSGTGSTEDQACRAAKKDANNSVPQGYYKRHCQCNCWR
jgi:RHS repeat-associated protein